MSDSISKSKHSRSSAASSSKDRKSKASSDSIKSREATSKASSKSSSKEKRGQENYGGSESDDEFALQVTSTPKNTAFLEVAASIEQSTCY